MDLQFERYTKPRTTGEYRLLILDGHESHLSLDFMVSSEEHKIITLSMPSHSSHVLQPLMSSVLACSSMCTGGRSREGCRLVQVTLPKRISSQRFWQHFEGPYRSQATIAQEVSEGQATRRA